MNISKFPRILEKNTRIQRKKSFFPFFAEKSGTFEGSIFVKCVKQLKEILMIEAYEIQKAA